MLSSLSVNPSQEEYASAWTHGLGLLLSLIGVPLLLYRGTLPDNDYLWWSLFLFGSSMILVYATSTIYHSVQEPRWKNVCRRADHISIYFLIAGTHTPFLAYYMPGTSGHFYLWLVWGMAIAGLFYKLFFFDRWEWLSVAFYLAMGWLGVVTVPQMMEQMPEVTLNGVVFGRLSYTIGVVFYAWRKLPYHHAIWHLFVIGGSLGHFLAIWGMLQVT